MTDPAIIVAIVTALGVVIAAIIMKFKTNDNDAKQDTQINDLQLKFERMAGRIEREKELEQLNWIKAFHSPHLKPLDALLQKVRNDIENKTDTISLEELQEAKKRLDAELQKIEERDEPNADVVGVAGAKFGTMLDIRILEKEHGI